MSTNKELYQKKIQAQIDEWKAEISKLKAQSAGASADAQLELNQQREELESKVNEAEDKLAELREASDDAWESLKEGVEAAWGSLKTGVNDAASKFNN